MNSATLSMPQTGAAQRPHAMWRLTGAVIAIVAIGCALRLASARGDLWLDEIWSLVALERITSAVQVFWAINNDNNHFLNSIYLYAVGRDAPTLVQRGLSVFLGTAAIVAAGVSSVRIGRPAPLIAMVLFALSYPMVHFASEARGYAGLVLFSLVALACLERELEHPHWTSRQGLGAAIGLGLLSHLTMAGGAAVLALWTFWIRWRRSSSLREAQAETRTIFHPALMWSLALTAVMLFGSLRHGFTVGGIDPFEPAQFVEGYGGLIRLLLGLPPQVPDWLCLTGAAVAIALATITWRNDPRTGLYVTAVILLPALMFAAHLPNLQFARYYLFPGAILLLFVSDCLARAWRQGGIWRPVAGVALLAMVAGNLVALRSFLDGQRGHYAAAVARMAANGSFVYGDDQDFRTPMLVDFFARQQGVTAVHAEREQWCHTTPDWLVIEDETLQRRDELEVSTCSLHYRREGLFDAWGLSGSRWALYRLKS